MQDVVHMAALGFELYKTHSAAQLRRAFAQLVRNPKAPGEYTRVRPHQGVCSDECYKVSKRCVYRWSGRDWRKVQAMPEGIYLKDNEK